MGVTTFREMSASRFRAAAGGAFVGATLYGEYGGDGISPPAAVRKHAAKIAIAHHHFDHEIRARADPVISVSPDSWCTGRRRKAELCRDRQSPSFGNFLGWHPPE
jgi:hypothetical protein